MLHDFICDRECKHIPAKWKDTYSEICSAVVESYRNNTLIAFTDYLFALDAVSRKDDDCENDDITEYKVAINTLLEDIEAVTPDERVRRVKAYNLSHFLFIADNWEDWATVKELLKSEGYRKFEDDTFLTWCAVVAF